eukprot:TRINITY_DN42925_c0_g1_i1.p1 TRINITY_DN42925_c0_g1~~TRINITY_DN42925_c0_g1_i1.p1  ORF type:complete len:187 (+),score=28.56 TRINITY_DN42925_c0_g1_i1:53-613(+)
MGHAWITGRSPVLPDCKAEQRGSAPPDQCHRPAPSGTELPEASGCNPVASFAPLLNIENTEQESRTIADVPNVTTPSRKRSRPSLETAVGDIIVGDDSIGFWKVEPTMAAATSLTQIAPALELSPITRKQGLQASSLAAESSQSKPKRRRSISQDERPPSRRNSFGRSYGDDSDGAEDRVSVTPSR